MKILAAFVSVLLVCGCSMRPKSSVAIMLVPASTRGVPPEYVERARAKLESDMARWGQVVTRYVKDADYWLHASYVPARHDPTQGYLLVVERERNPMKENSPHYTVMFRPAITDEISGGPVPGFR